LSLDGEVAWSKPAPVPAGDDDSLSRFVVCQKQRGKTNSHPSAACLAQAPAPYYETPGVGYNGTIRYTNSNAMMNYNALETTFRQRLWHGLQYTANYTFSRAMTNSTGFYGVPSITVASAYAENVYDLHS
jgi:hypothetical protein